MKHPPTPSIYAYSWNHGKPSRIPGVMLRTENMRVFVPKDQLLTFSDVMVDAYETYEQEQE